MSWQDAINAAMGRSQDTTYDLTQVAMGNWQGPADGGSVIASVIANGAWDDTALWNDADIWKDMA